MFEPGLQVISYHLTIQGIPKVRSAYIGHLALSYG